MFPYEMIRRQGGPSTGNFAMGYRQREGNGMTLG